MTQILFCGILWWSVLTLQLSEQCCLCMLETSSLTAAGNFWCFKATISGSTGAAAGAVIEQVEG